MLQKLEFTGNNNEFIKNGAVTMTQEDGCTVVMTVPEHEMWQSIAGRNEKPMCVFFAKEVEPGIYETRLNFHMGMKQYTDFQVISSHERLGKDGLPKKYDHDSSMINYFNETVSPYGVADNVEQIKRY
jgi:hypothetical protein